MKNKRKNSKNIKSKRTGRQAERNRETRETSKTSGVNRNKKDYVTYEKLEDDAKTKKKNNKRKFKKGKLLSVVFILVYIPSLVYWFFGNNIATDIIYAGVIEDSININALLVRDETVLKAPFSGEYIPQIEEGDKVSAYSTVATVLDSSSSKLLDEINEINKKILFTQKEKNKSKEIFNQDIIKIENEIGHKVIMIASEANNNNFERIRQVKHDIDRLIEKKAEIAGEDGSDDVYIKSLKEQRDTLMKKMNTNMPEKKSESSGVVSYIIDGYEDILKPQAIDQLTPEIFEDILSDEVIEKDLSNRKVEADKPFAKIINDFQYNIVVCLESDVAASFEAGKRVSIRINDINKQIRCDITFVSNEHKGKKIIAIDIDKYIEELTGVRRINIDLIKSSYEGLIIPLRCLRNIDFNTMKADIVLLKGDVASVREVEIKGKNNEYAVIEATDNTKSKSTNKGIALYDTYIINPKNIQDGQVIN